PDQLSFAATTTPAALRTSKRGSAHTPGTLYGASPMRGPTTRIKARTGPPLTAKPGIKVASVAVTTPRAEMFANTPSGVITSWSGAASGGGGDPTVCRPMASFDQADGPPALMPRTR